MFSLFISGKKAVETSFPAIGEVLRAEIFLSFAPTHGREEVLPTPRNFCPPGFFSADAHGRVAPLAKSQEGQFMTLTGAPSCVSTDIGPRGTFRFYLCMGAIPGEGF